MIQQSHSWAYTYLEKMKTLIQQDKCTPNVLGSIIYNSQDIETT